MQEDHFLNLLTTASEAARKGGAYLNESRASSAVVTLDAGRDVKLLADHEAEEIIITSLQSTSFIPILSEERGAVATRNEETDLRWIVDPLDGSFNYLRGIPMCCVSVGLWKNDVPILGVIYDFTRGELFSGIIGQGAWLNDRPIRVSATSEARKALLCSGFPVSTDFSSPALHTFVEQVQQYRKVRLLGTAALSLAYVASGRADCYYERDIKIWDVAAGLAIVRAAGGQVIWTPEDHQHGVSVYAANSALTAPPL
jgi:fructose-1,6-bisphosphatase/inositol monophosphatase family enzyme